jgi:hypothetical protein
MGNDNYEFVQKIDNKYVSADCIQIMIAHCRDMISILNSDGMTYHYVPNSFLYTNKYASDPRRKQFPYSDSLTHRERVHLRKVEFVNQIFDFGRVYLVIADGFVREHFVIKDGDDTLMTTKYLLPELGKTQFLKTSEVEDLIKNSHCGAFDYEGGCVQNLLPLEENILENYRQRLINAGNESLARKIDIQDVPSNYYRNNLILVSKGDDGEINSVKYVDISFINPNYFQVISYECPVTKYTQGYAEYLRQISLREIREPKLKKTLRPNNDYFSK